MDPLFGKSLLDCARPCAGLQRLFRVIDVFLHALLTPLVEDNVRK
jgi:hypothetical protein